MLVLPIANSSIFVLPVITAPASLSRLTTVASKGEQYPVVSYQVLKGYR